MNQEWKIIFTYNDFQVAITNRHSVTWFFSDGNGNSVESNDRQSDTSKSFCYFIQNEKWIHFLPYKERDKWILTCLLENMNSFEQTERFVLISCCDPSHNCK